MTDETDTTKPILAGAEWHVYRSDYTDRWHVALRYPARGSRTGWVYPAGYDRECGTHAQATAEARALQAALRADPALNV